MTARTDTEAVPMRIADVRRQPGEPDATRHYILVLEEVGGARLLPIWVGQAEGTAIALQLEKIEVPRPLTFAFMAHLLQAAGVRLREVRISKLGGDTFYASALIEGPEGTKSVDARPSDALALALAVGAPVFAAPAVLEASEAWHAAHPDPAHRAWQQKGVEGARDIVAEVTSKWPGFGASASEPR